MSETFSFVEVFTNERLTGFASAVAITAATVDTLTPQIALDRELIERPRVRP